MNNLDKSYTNLLQDILDNGVTKKDRTGTGTLSVFGRQIRHKMSEGFPLLTTKELHFKSIVTELLWFLRCDTNIKYLVENGCNIWNGDCYKYFKSTFSQMPGIQSSLPSQKEFIEKIKTDDNFAKKWGELGPIYGKQWRNWGSKQETNNILGTTKQTKPGIDQIKNVIEQLKTNPDSRRLMVNAWNVGEIDSMVLPPCHYGFQLYTRELSFKEQETLPFRNPPIMDWDDVEKSENKEVPTRVISLMWNQRSVDTFLGLPFNIASYGLLLEIIAKEVNMIPDEIIGNLGDVHLYLNHIDQAKEQIGRDLTIPERYEIYGKEHSITSIHHMLGVDVRKHTPSHTREPFELPKLKINDDNVKWKQGDCLPYYSPSDFELENYKSHPKIQAPLSN